MSGNPRRDGRDIFGRNLWYPYYAGFSPRFAVDSIASANLARDSLVVDPWNGGGTTTWAASYLGFKSWGGDLNPAMVVIARAKCLSRRNCSSAAVLSEQIVRSARRRKKRVYGSPDPLDSWLDAAAVSELRALESAIRQHLVPKELGGGRLSSEAGLLSEMACFFYLALFLVARKLSAKARTSNPTWNRGAQDVAASQPGDVETEFLFTVRRLAQQTFASEQEDVLDFASTELEVVSSKSLSLADASVDFVLTSPPYCTRIDYAVATSVELAVLGISKDEVMELRRGLMGTTTVPKKAGEIDPGWGQACTNFLASVEAHPSHASAVYYYKSHVQYFSDLHDSIKELSRVLKPGAKAVVVVQDSQYKEIRNDLALVVTQMARSAGLVLKFKADFKKALTLRTVHPHSRKYGTAPTPVESVLTFQAN